MFAAAGTELGYAVLTFEGPGQGVVLRQQKVTMRPDWEVVSSCVLDYLSEYSSLHTEFDLDLDRIAISGASMGGYYAIRAASDPRIKACLSIDPFYDMWDFATTRVPSWFINAWTGGWFGDGFFNSTIDFLSRHAFQMKWEFAVTRWIFGCETPAEAMYAMRKFTSKQKDGDFLDKVNCPVFVTGAAHSFYFDEEADTLKIYKTLKHLPEDQKKVWIPKNPGEGGLQAKIGAWGVLQTRSFEFLDGNFGIQRDKISVN